MKKHHDFKLISGEFSVEDAGDVLLQMIRAKINHHQCCEFSNEERYGQDYMNSRKRIAELRNAEADLRAFLADAKDGGARLSIESMVKITVTADEPVIA